MHTHATQSGEPRPDRAGLDRPTIVAFGIFVVLVAANVVAIRFTNRGLPPFWGAGTRFAIASILFFLYVLIRRLPLPRGRALAGTLLFGVLQFGIGFALGYWALLEVPAGLASVILASVPLFTLLFAFAARLEPLRMRGVVGALVAIGGIALIYGERAGKDIPTAYLLAAVGTAACFALVPVIVKSFPPVHPATMNALGMLTGALMLLGISFASNEIGVIPGDLATRAAYLYLVLLGSVGVFVLYLFVLKRWTASGVSYQAVLSPLVAIALSAWLLDESLTGGLFWGGALVIAGVYVGALAPFRQRA
jgi:drug/metabolite transporter (DMT)-like permease